MLNAVLRLHWSILEKTNPVVNPVVASQKSISELSRELSTNQIAPFSHRVLK